MINRTTSQDNNSNNAGSICYGRVSSWRGAALALLFTALLVATLGLSGRVHAQTEETFAMGIIFANELDATMGCSMQAGVAAVGGFCWSTNLDASLHRTMVDLLFSRYYDLTTLTPWAALDGGGWGRAFRVAGMSDSYAVYVVPSGSYTSYGFVAVLGDEH